MTQQLTIRKGGEFLDHGDQLFVVDGRRDVPEAKSGRADEHVQVLQHRPLVLLQLGSLLQVGSGYALFRKFLNIKSRSVGRASFKGPIPVQLY